VLVDGADHLGFGELLGKITSHWTSRSYARVLNGKHGGSHPQFKHIHALTVNR
jgi:hypothetical protein